MFDEKVITIAWDEGLQNKLLEVFERMYLKAYIFFSYIQLQRSAYRYSGIHSATAD